MSEDMRAQERALAARAKAEEKAEKAAARQEAKRERQLDREAERRGSKPVKRSAARTAAVVTGRSVVGVVGIVATAAVISGIALVPWPSVGVAAPVAQINPTAEDQLRACPGPFMTVGADPTQANVVSSLGPSSVVSSGGTASSLSSSNPNAAQDGAAQAFSDASTAAPLAAAQSQNLALDNYAGLSAAACTAPLQDSWLIGGDTALGSTAVLVLSNPSKLASIANVQLYGAAGPIETVGLNELEVPAGSQRLLPLSGYAINESAPVVHITTQGGRLSAAIDYSHIDGVTPTGADTIGPSAQAATKVSIPGVVVDSSIGLATQGEGADGAANVRVLVPGTTPANVSISVVGDNGAAGSAYTVTAQPGVATTVPLNGLAPGTYTVWITSDQPLVAAAQSALTAAEGTDVAWFASADNLPALTAFAVPAGAPATLHLANPTTGSVTVNVNGASQITLTVPAGAASSVAIPAGSWTASGGAGAVASVSLQSAGRLASLAVPGASADASVVSVYTR